MKEYVVLSEIIRASGVSQRHAIYRVLAASKQEAEQFVVAKRLNDYRWETEALFVRAYELDKLALWDTSSPWQPRRTG